jgi:phosphoribosylanthranilate isomerase
VFCAINQKLTGLLYANACLQRSLETALEIVNALPPFINRVGLFVNADSSFIDEVLCEVPLDTLQFHGDEADSVYTEKRGLPCIIGLGKATNFNFWH